MVFKVSGFSTHGKVTVNKAPVAGATVLVNNAPKAETDEQGRYQLNDVKEGSYVISAKKKNFEFEKINIALSSSNPNIPDVTAKK